MNTLLFRSATLVHPQSEYHQKSVDVLIRDGKIEQVAEHIEVSTEGLEVVNAEGCYLAPGFFDLNASFGEPGHETREDLISGTSAAIAGGFTGIAIQPATNPPVHSKSEVAYILSRSSRFLADVHPIGCISQNREGKDLAELYDMKLAGAVAFSDGNKPINDSGLMSRALLYAKAFEGLVISYPEDSSVAGKGKMNEGIVSTYLGMKGIPSLAEEIAITRDLYLAEYNDSRIHFSTISAAGSVKLIREAKARGIQVTCDVAVHHLVLTDEVLKGFDTNYKVKPPLRTQDDLDALIEGLKDGTIDAIVSQHTPHEIEFKDVEFEIASFGIIGLQTVLPLALKTGLPVELLVEKLAINPRKILGLPVPGMERGENANLVMFSPDLEWVFDSSSNKSKSANSPFIGETLKGRVLAVCNNEQFYYQQ